MLTAERVQMLGGVVIAEQRDVAAVVVWRAMRKGQLP